MNTPDLPSASDSAPWAGCDCFHCGVTIEFPAEHAGSDIACPRCGQRTTLACRHATPNTAVPAGSAVDGGAVIAPHSDGGLDVAAGRIVLWMAGISACIILGVITLASLPWERRNPEAVQNARELKSAIADVRAELDFVPPALRRLGDKIALFEGRFAMAKTTLTPAQLWAVNLLQIDLDRFIPLAGQASKYAAPEIFFYPAAQYRFCVGMTRDSADEAMRRLSEK